MKLFLNLSLIVVTILAYCAEDIYLYLKPPQIGEPTYISIRCQDQFNYDQEKALGGKRNLALSQYVPIYTFLPDQAKLIRQNINSFRDTINDLKSEKKKADQELIGYVKKTYGIDITPEEAQSILVYPNIANLLAGIMTIEESLLNLTIVQDLKHYKGKPTIEIIYPEPIGIISHPTDKLIELDDARQTLSQKVKQLFWQVDSSVLDAVLKITQSSLLPNLKYDKKANDERLDQIIRRYPSKIISYKPAQVLVPFYKNLLEEDVILLTEYKKEHGRTFLAHLIWIIFTIIAIVIFFNTLLLLISASYGRKRPPCELLLSALIVTIILMKTGLLFTPLPFYILPIGLLPIMLVLLNQDKFSALLTACVGALFVTLFSGNQIEILLFFVFGTIVALLATKQIQRRIHIMIPTFAVGIINMVCIFILFLDWRFAISLFDDSSMINFQMIGQILNRDLLMAMGWALLGGFLAGPLALLLLPLFELGWRTASTFKLNQYIDLQNPLMRDLLTKSPGTYQHTMTVAYLAQTVGEAIGANLLLLRIGAYYHDIGKIASPKLFVENQFDGNNSHDTLNPVDSKNLIIDHVNNGMKFGREAGIPEVILDFITQHHGTQLVEYFYNKAAKAEGANISKDDFRYPGPKPQSIETAILMIVDSVEAASRSLKQPTREDIQKMIRFIVESKMSDGQFDECDLSTRDLSKIINTLAEAVEASFHSRVKYPWQEKKEADPESE